MSIIFVTSFVCVLVNVFAKGADTMQKITMRAARVNAGLTQQEAATRLGVNRDTISRWERGDTSPPMRRVQSIAALYKIPVEEIIFLP